MAPVHVLATAGHVDHGKSTLVRALTGTEPDRWAEERRRGLTLDLGFVWTTLPGGERVAFVDVPGHERFVPTMLAGVGPVPAVLLVVAADGGWMPQTSEHVAALDALGVTRGVVALTRCDLADPRDTAAVVRERLGATGLRDATVVPVSAVTGAGLDALRAALRTTVRALPSPDPHAPVRMWVDRVFTVRGAGTVVTGTLQAGTVRRGDTLRVARDDRQVTVRSLQVTGEDVEGAGGVARVALNLRGVDRHDLTRGDALLGPGRRADRTPVAPPWRATDALDVVLDRPVDDPPSHLVLHTGSAAVPARLRPLAADVVRLRLDRPLPLAAGDRALLRAPDRHEVVAGLRVADVDPPPARGRRGAAERAAQLTRADGAHARWRRELTRREVLSAADAAGLGLVPDTDPVVPGWYVDPQVWAGLPGRAATVVAAWEVERPLEPGAPRHVVRERLGLPDGALLDAVVARTSLRSRDGRLTGRERTALPAPVEAALADLSRTWRDAPFAAPEAHRLRDLGLGRRELAAAERAGRVVVLADQVVLPAGAHDRAARALRALAEPFTVSAARELLGTTRRVAVPLLEHLDRTGVTEQVSPGLRRLTAAGAAAS
ncbi:selenocysteine-specific translation elongation factor [Thalassiella azotivora]